MRTKKSVHSDPLPAASQSLAQPDDASANPVQAQARLTPPTASLEPAETGRRSLCVFLGAGASTLGGYRTFLTFPHMFWPTTTEPAILKATDRERSLLSAIHKELERKRRPLTLDQYLGILHNYHVVLENIFSDEELRSRFSDSLLFFARIQELNQVVQGAVARICRLTMDHYRRPPELQYFQRVRAFYNFLFHRYQDVELFTTNYDLVPEYLFSDNDSLVSARNEAWRRQGQEQDLASLAQQDERLYREIQFINGFPGLSRVNAPNAPNTDKHHWQRLVLEGRKSSKTLSLFRLHGCVAWYRVDGTVCFDMSELDQVENYFDRVCVMYPGRAELIGRDPLAYSFERLYDACLMSPVILFIGFAFRDHDVASVVFSAIRQRLQNSENRTRIVIVDPYLDEDYFYARLDDVRKHIAAPLALRKENLDVRVVRSEFPPGPDQIRAIVDLLEGTYK